VGPVIESHCAVCHTPGGVSANWSLTNYDQLYTLRFEAQSELASCEMPPADAGQLTASERAALLGWLVCGAPQN
jgi:mono/diheme cytochrome c family protein